MANRYLLDVNSDGLMGIWVSIMATEVNSECFWYLF